MNNRLFTMGAGLLLAASAVAGPAGVKEFPSQLSPEAAQAATTVAPASVQRAPLNPHKDSGTKMFGYTTQDFNGVCNYINLYTENPRNLDKLRTITVPGYSNFDDDLPRYLGNLGGVWAGDAYYTYRMIYYDLGYTYLENWVKVDTETGEPDLLHKWNLSVDAGDWLTFPQSLLWNPNDPDGLQVITQSARRVNGATVAASAIYNVDRASGQYTTRVAQLDEYYFAAVYGYDNQLYAIRWDYTSAGDITGTVLDVFDSSDFSEPVSSTKISVDGKPWYIYFQNALTMDYNTGDLWWCAVQISNYPAYHAGTVAQPEVETRLVKIDPLTGATENKGAIGFNEIIGGMYVPYATAESLQAPARVNGLDFTIDPQGADKVTVSWTNPSTRWDRRKLSDLTAVQVYRDKFEGEPVATLDATGKEGQKMSWTDEGASRGVHTYYVVPVNKAGKGVPANIDAFVGRDVPGPVSNLTATTVDGKTIQLSWDKPVRGDNDGWFDDSDLQYSIVRMPDNKDLGIVSATSYNDTDLDEAKTYTYIVTAINTDGKGTPVESNGVLAGQSIVVPFSTTFANEVEAGRFSTIDKNLDNRTWEYANDMTGSGRKVMYISHNCEDVLVTPPMLLEKDKTYKVVYDLNFFSFGETGQTIDHPLRVLGGTAATAEGMNIVLDATVKTVPVHTQSDVYTVYFKSPVDGEFFVGLEDSTNDKLSTGMSVLSFSIEEAPDDDLQAVSVSTHLTVSTIENNTFSVEVYNNGSKPQSAYVVKVAYIGEDGEPVVFASTDLVPEIPSHQTEIIELEGRPDELGEFALVGIVEMEGDGNSSNDRTPELMVSFDEAPALNHTVTDYTELGKSTGIPMSFYYRYTTAQTIYSPEMTGFDRIFKDKAPKITRMAWEYLGKAAFTDTKVDVYFTQTDLKCFYSPDNTFISDPEATRMVPLTGVEPVFAGEVAVANGNHYMVIDLDNEFAFDPSRSILVTVVKDNASQSGTFPIEFNAFDTNWNRQEMHSFLYQGSQPYNLSAPEGRMNVSVEAPVLHLTVKAENSGIDEVVLTGNGSVYYNALTASVESIGFAMASVDVYTMGGQMVKTVKVAEGASSVAVNCAKGMYLLKVNGVDGRSITLKAQVK